MDVVYNLNIVVDLIYTLVAYFWDVFNSACRCGTLKHAKFLAIK